VKSSGKREYTPLIDAKVKVRSNALLSAANRLRAFSSSLFKKVPVLYKPERNKNQKDSLLMDVPSEHERRVAT
jgi:hypothetical protein